PAPGVAVEIEVLQSEVRAKRLELVHEAVGPPERGVVGTIRFAAAELVVQDDAAIGARKRFERLQVEAAASRPSVQEDERPVAFAQDAAADGAALDLDLDLASFLVHA